MNILFISENYFPVVSGVPVVVKYLAEGLLSKGNNVSILTRKYAGLKSQESINGVNVIRFSLSQNRFFKSHGEIEAFRNFVLKSNPDILVVECAECVTTNVVLPILHNVSCKKIFHSHGFSGLTIKPFEYKGAIIHTLGNFLRWATTRIYYNFWFKKYIGLFDMSFCLSDIDSSKRYLEMYSKKMKVLSNAVDDMFLKPALRCPIPLPKKYFLSIANYSSVKNQKGILREFYKAEMHDYSMVFVGRDHNKYLDELSMLNEHYAKKWGKRTVLFLYGIDRQYIPYIVENASLYLVGSTFEEFSISIIEAMAKGIPFISTNVGNARILPGGLTVDDEYQINKAIKKLISSPKELKKYSIEGEKFVMNNCRRERVVDQLNSILQTL